MAEQSVGRGAADRVVREVNVDWRRPGQRPRSAVRRSRQLGHAKRMALTILIKENLDTDHLLFADDGLSTGSSHITLGVFEHQEKGEQFFGKESALPYRSSIRSTSR